MSPITSIQAQHIALRHWNIAGTASPLSSEWGGTFRIQTSDKAFLLKVAPEHLNDERIALEIAATQFIAQSSPPILIPRSIPSLEGPSIINSSFGRARMFEWIDGDLWSDITLRNETLLESLGIALGSLTKALEGFDHPGAHEHFIWSPHDKTWKEALALLPEDLREICAHYVARYESLRTSRISTLRHSVNYHDANDHNILVSKDPLARSVIGFIDFGDCHYAPIIQELAICLAYALMDQSDIPGTVRHIIKGYHQVFPVREEELEVLTDMICLRLVMSLAHAASRHSSDPTNAYWQVSTSAAETLLRALHGIPPHLLLCFYREACGYEPSPVNQRLCNWLTENQKGLHPILGFPLSKEAVTVFDWSVSSAALGNFDTMDDLEAMTFRVFHQMKTDGSKVGIGRYDEPRPIYTTDEYKVPGLHTSSMRTIHLGIDVFMPPNTPVYAPLHGKVVTVVNNAGDKEYGPLVILEHTTGDGLTFYTLYGHNNIYTLSRLKPGQEVRAGSKIAEIGPYPENGNWVPHLHFQIMTDLLHYTDDFPGVADPNAREVWLSLCPDPNLILGIDHPDLKYHYADQEGLLKTRRHLLGKNLSVSYSKPLHIVRGWKTSLYDEYGRTYLDTVNNIAHVGHEHPRVTEAGCAQMTVLNTNTRYLHRNILALSRKLKETLPGHLEVLYFVNSGSEANELALRMARAYTGHENTLVLEEGYHGNTQACINVSHYKFKKLGKPETSTIIPLRVYNNYSDRNLEGYINGPMVFIHESLPSCAGQIVPHEDFFMDMYAEVKKHGGICIADEVQTGLGRIGSHYWAFELFTLAPDIVTIGKPLGNGHPVAAVACTREIAERFAEGVEFFSSFGGNPVSCAIALEVLSVIEDEGLQQHALDMGEYWKAALQELQKDHPLIADVRGHGLFLGIEFLEPDTGRPAIQKAKYIVQRMLDHRILTSLDGPYENVMKIKPPMSIGREEVDRFVEVLRKVVREI